MVIEVEVVEISNLIAKRVAAVMLLIG